MSEKECNKENVEEDNEKRLYSPHIKGTIEAETVSETVKGVVRWYTYIRFQSPTKYPQTPTVFTYRFTYTST